MKEFKGLWTGWVMFLLPKGVAGVGVALGGQNRSLMVGRPKKIRQSASVF